MKVLRNHSSFIKVLGFSYLGKTLIRVLGLIWVSILIKDMKKLKCVPKNFLKY